MQAPSIQSPSIQSPALQTPASPLDQLADIHLPDSVSWWPLAPGWWALLALVIIVLVGFFIWRHRKTQNAYRDIAQHQLDSIYADYQQTQNAAAYLQALSLLLRRTALTAYPHSFNASIKGKEWLQWLDQVCPALPEKFSSELGENLLTSAYQKNPHIDVSELQQLSSQWIRLHRNHRQKLSISKKATAKKTTNATEANHV
ncbi:DUF4381 domain-containing protein [Cellvibrio sp. OA-2007]|uniref:DUF4381 domain-containing protein n=1 Tax=Cellvibrio sp. OA-2007 TaxID=529823 RepID=UPI0007837ACE|nr:DUF4381 domain-containing protein [Cellvibrio sp. OA-2007]